MGSGSLRPWIPLLGGFLTGQAGVQFVNFLTGILILRFLSLEEYAIYTLAAVLQGVGNVGSDFGTSQGVISIGAPIRERREQFASLLRAALRLRTQFFLLMTPAMGLLAIVLFRENAPTGLTTLAILAVVALNVWVQQSATLATAVLNARHDARGLLIAGMATGLLRLLLVLIACSSYPYAITAITVNLVGAALGSRLLWRQSAVVLSSADVESERSYRARLLRFAIPLVPGAIYYLCQSQVANLLLALAGATTSIAEVGALGRLAQLIGLLSLLNGFFVIPYFARIEDHREFVRRAGQALLIASVCGGALVVSALIAPAIWLSVLGPNYQGLARDVVLVVGNGALLLAGNVVYAMVLAAKVTKGQWIGNALGLAAQLWYVWQFGISDTRSALILNLIPVIIACMFQSAVLGWFMFSDRKKGA